MTEIKIKLVCPLVPNFIAMELPSRPKQEGFNLDGGVDIADLSEVQLREIGVEWTAELIKNAERRKAARSKDVLTPRQSPPEKKC